MCMHVRTYVRMYVYMYVCIHACLYACIYVCMYVCMYVCKYVTSQKYLSNGRSALNQGAAPQFWKTSSYEIKN